ncbi:MAG: aromatic amino acid transport family protein [Candidatus Nanoarchaeia archaeon]|nr:hypothetical protein [Candidatus Haiyanarchaeum thermophilum]MCW1303032.1 hypothetical protein [Candidatus Haiyanarchaeum thermophilum]MCW1303710.1 hypothetical protein [Candidatus Haiyanarchaeum thermophilum]MCW1306390.1 hypothetical protein [Candidatus Haiyanarchaeum thermophilum]MCW1307100.1 hypothetical protein [Candidatus Haiyanarchaeum thermophilum]
MDWDFLKGVAAILGTVIGAGILAIPYVFWKAGFLSGLICLIIVGLISILILLYVGEISLRTKETLQIVGLVGKYLGRKSKSLMLILQVLGIYGALIAYMIGVAEIFNSILGIEPPVTITIFFLLTFPVVYLGLKVVEKVEFYLSYLKILLIITLSFLLFPYLNLENLLKFNPSKLLLPYGVLTFACTGYSVIPNLERILEKKKGLMKPCILSGMLLSIFIYLLFAIAFVGYLDGRVEEIATNSFGDFSLKIFASITTLLLLTTPYIILAWVLKDTFIFDYQLRKPIPAILACVVPFLVAFIATPSFMRMLEISGAYAGSLTYIIFCFLVIRARKNGDCKPPYVVPFGNKPLYFISILGIFGILYTTLSLLSMI